MPRHLRMDQLCKALTNPSEIVGVLHSVGKFPGNNLLEKNLSQNAQRVEVINCFSGIVPVRSIFSSQSLACLKFNLHLFFSN